MENIDSFVIALQRSGRKMNSQTLRSGRLCTRAKLWGVEARRAGGGLPRSAPPRPRGPDPAESNPGRGSGPALSRLFPPPAVINLFPSLPLHLQEVVLFICELEK